MGLEVASFVNDLVAANPAGGDGKSQGDDHLRLIKSALQATFPLAIAARKFRNDDAGATDTLTWQLYRKSATPAANDLLGSFAISGDSSTAVERIFARLQAQIISATNGDEEGALRLLLMKDGAETQAAKFETAGINFAYPLIGAGRPPLITDATASGNYVKTAGARFLQIMGCGAGAGSGGIDDTGTGVAATAGGGGGFSGWSPMINLSAVPASVAFVIGLGGIAGDFNSNGGTGGSTSISLNGLSYVWGGGIGSEFRIVSSNTCAFMDGGLGGVHSGTGNLIGWSMQGYPAGMSFLDDQVMAGAGGSSMFGRGGEGRRSITPGASGGGLSGVDYGAGASGAFNNSANGDQLGAAGTDGFLRFTEYF